MRISNADASFSGIAELRDVVVRGRLDHLFHGALVSHGGKLSEVVWSPIATEREIVLLVSRLFKSLKRSLFRLIEHWGLPMALRRLLAVWSDGLAVHFSIHSSM